MGTERTLSGSKGRLENNTETPNRGRSYKFSDAGPVTPKQESEVQALTEGS